MRKRHLQSTLRLLAAAAAVAACAGCAWEGTEAEDEDVARQAQALHQEGGWAGKGSVVGVMTRNVYYGADLAPVLATTDLPSLASAIGAVLRQVTATNFPVRAEGLAREIRSTNPDLVSLQEVALWRTGAPSLAPLLGGPKTATAVRYDFLELLLGELNEGKERYRAVLVQDAFDFEGPADENGTSGDGPAPVSNAELNLRLTMRNVILQRIDAGVQVGAPETAVFEHQMTVPVLGRAITFTRGYAKVEARVRGSAPFQFVATHLEPYNAAAGAPSVATLQANELVARFGRSRSDRPVVLAGDLNTDGRTGPPEKRAAYRELQEGGFVERSSSRRRQQTCCIESSYDLTTGSVRELDERLDHIMTNAPGKVQLVGSVVTGLRRHDGYWSSDHAGVFSALRIR